MRSFALAAVLLALSAVGATAQPSTPPLPDYANPAAWVCRPGEETACTTGLDAMVITADGARTPQTFQPAADPPIDCFYVYPTVSQEPTAYADMAASPEVVATVRSQAGRLTSRCRLYAPIYRQLTSAGLDQILGSNRPIDWSRPYADVRAAWRWYMAHDNHGRGVVIVGHSQGTILLQQLIAEEIDGKPAQKRLVGAFLAGDPALSVPHGARVGGTFKSTPLCAAAGEVGCVYVWADYVADDADAHRLFGHSPGGGLVAGCVSPAAPGGGAGSLKAYLAKPEEAPDGDPPWIELVGQLSAQCQADAQGHVVRVSVLPGRYQARLTARLERSASGSGWGLHRLDMGLPQGNILDVLAAESAAWTRR
ncbi:DUF3089 domain-containing protein [Caulobacter sp. S45]|uniref:DUF3089 domain-containing protein n=1 Tax=Caulobacter sp. S45 TaxID=1641861 RepID=UPI00157584FE|nr:DUF3089 domain-containing protein [Caulobacter sp. S45]